MKCAVVGGAGYVGSFTAHTLKEEKHKVVVIDDLSSGHEKAIEGFPLVRVDIVNEAEKLEEVFRKETFDAVLHFAALIQMGESMERPALYFRHNVLGSLNLLEAVRKSKVIPLVFSSTAGVYGNPEKLPMPEDHPKSPTSPYGESKVMVEKLLGWYWQIYKLPSASIRYFNAAGASRDGKLGEDHPNESHIIPLAMKSLLSGEKFTLYGNDYPTPDGTCIRDYVNVVDLAEVHISALSYLEKKPGAHSFNAGTGRGFSNLEVLKMIEQITGKKVDYEVAERRSGDATSLIADPTKAEQELSWKPRFSDLKTIVATSWLWHKNHPKGFGV